MTAFGPALAGLVRALRARRGATLVFVVALTALLALRGQRLRLDEDLLAFLPQDDPKISEHARTFKAFKALDTLRVDLGPAKDRERLAAAAASFERDLAVSPLISRVFSGVTPERGADIAFAMLKLAERSLPLLVGPDEIASVVSRCSTDEALDEKLRDAFVTLNSMESPGAKGPILRDPLGIEGAFWKHVQSLQSAAQGARLENGRIVSTDGQHVLFLVEPKSRASRTADAEEVLALIESATRTAGVEVAYAGGHRGAPENARTIKRDAWLSSIVSLACMLLVYGLIFPRRWVIPLTVLPLAFGGIFGLAACQAILGTVSAIAVGFGGILLGLADDFIVHLYYFYEVRARDGHPEPAVSAVERVAIPTLAAGASIAAAFVSLAISGFPGQRDLAVFATTSLAGTIAFCLLIQPLLLPSTKAPRPLPRAGGPVRILIGFVERHEKLVLGLVALATVALAVAAIHPRIGVRFEDDPRAIEWRSAETKADDAELNARWGDPSGLGLVVARGATLEAALEQDDRAYERLTALREAGVLQGVSSIAPLLPAKSTQTARASAWRALWPEEARAKVRERIVRLGRAHRFTPRAFEPFFERLERDAEPVDAEALLAGPLRELVDSRIKRDEKGWLVVTFVRLSATEGDERLAWAAGFERETGALVTTGRTFAKAIGSLIREKLVTCGALGFLVVLALLVPALRRPKHVLAAALPLLLGLVWSAGIFALTGTKLNLINFLIPVLTFGLSVDYVLFLASGYLEEAPAPDEVEQAQGAVVASSATTLAGMASLLLAKHPALWSVGVVALVGTASSVLAIFLVTPSLLRKR